MSPSRLIPFLKDHNQRTTWDEGLPRTDHYNLSPGQPQKFPDIFCQSQEHCQPSFGASDPDLAILLNKERRMSTTTHPQPITEGPKHVNREKAEGMLRHTRLVNEPREYLQKREELRLAEMEMFRNIERVAALRRALPAGAEVTDYVFQEGPRDLVGSDSPLTSVRLSELFSGAGRPLIVYHFMYGKRNTTACPMCTMWIDTFNAIAPHLARNVDLAIAAAADLAPLRDYARSRGWHNLRLLRAGRGNWYASLDYGTRVTIRG
jgi:predicted dithiol-disulfide oxidoreductase (DUF899 family)